MAVRRGRNIDWTSWRAVDPATLVFIIKDDRVLLIRKKRGLGAGKVNGPGGRLEPGETFKACAIREVQEELLVTTVDPVRVGQHAFQFIDGYSSIRNLNEDESEFKSRSIASIKRAKRKANRSSVGGQSDENIKSVKREVKIPEVITIRELANRMAEQSSNIIKHLFGMGVTATINLSLIQL